MMFPSQWTIQNKNTYFRVSYKKKSAFRSLIVGNPFTLFTVLNVSLTHQSIIFATVRIQIPDSITFCDKNTCVFMTFLLMLYFHLLIQAIVWGQQSNNPLTESSKKCRIGYPMYPYSASPHFTSKYYKIKKISGTWPKCNKFWRQSAHISMTNLRPSLQCVLKITARNRNLHSFTLQKLH